MSIIGTSACYSISIQLQQKTYIYYNIRIIDTVHLYMLHILYKIQYAEYT